MLYIKIINDYIRKAVLPKGYVPEGLVELLRYSRNYGSIKFNFTKSQDGFIVAESENFRYGSIVTSGKDDKELDTNIKDAILTAFSIPSSYSKEAKIMNDLERAREYVVA